MGTTLKFYINENKKSIIDSRYPMYLRIVHERKKSEGRIRATPISEHDIRDHLLSRNKL
ncbi:hypothetical protein [Flavivirga algicola]|uniref:Arm DNA-binding domain-containing protein n=1 Tax=Flavivirga algicola TaxID=2729136 RepID=A0ABX1RY08_9FLAO|nr:hypothetical protein [Flavivirga algicola]NMH88451.1 hypothetical protein [Flavivirga algicola]